jgi:hypothetical protein
MSVLGLLLSDSAQSSSGRQVRSPAAGGRSHLPEERERVRVGNLHAAEPQEVLAVIDCSLQNGLSVRRSCLIPMIQYRRIVRWQQWVRRGLGLQDRRLGPTEPLHKLLPEET